MIRTTQYRMDGWAEGMKENPQGEALGGKTSPQSLSLRLDWPRNKEVLLAALSDVKVMRQLVDVSVGEPVNASKETGA